MGGQLIRPDWFFVPSPFRSHLKTPSRRDDHAPEVHKAEKVLDTMPVTYDHSTEVMPPGITIVLSWHVMPRKCQ